jgi:hypothetical protein
MNQTVSLMGGLGNQLFQLAFALHVSNGELVELAPILRNVRRNSFGQPELMSLKLPNSIYVNKNEAFDGKIKSKFLALGLRVSSTSNSRLVVETVPALTRLLTPFTGVQLRFGKGLGARIEVESKRIRTIYVGYFQSQYFSTPVHIRSDLMKLHPVKNSQHLDRLIAKVQKQDAIMLHVRLTDYEQSIGYGIPSRNYYGKAIATLFSQSGSKPIWIFSDDPIKALQVLPTKYSHLYRVADSLPDVSQTWELMRHFHGYIIANSSFSWWAAYLRRMTCAPVILPWPWFDSGGHSKGDLVADGWIALNKSPLT